MKRYNSIILGTIMAFTLFGSVGCEGNHSAPNDDSAQQTIEVGETLDGRTLWNGFETFDRDVQLLRLLDNFGRVSQNEDEKYVRTGSKSLQITPKAKDAGGALNPYMFIPSTSVRYSDDLSFSDFSKVDHVSLWFYNPQAEDISVGVSVASGSVYEINRKDYSRRIYSEQYALKTGWNHIVYEVMPAYLALQDVDVSMIYGLLLEFDYKQVQASAEPFSVYLDDVCLAYTDEKRPDEVDFNVKKGTQENGNEYWELSDFEDPRQGYYYAYRYEFPAPIASYPLVKPVFAGDYGIQAKSGSQVLLIRKHFGDTLYGWPMMQLRKEVFCAALEAIGQDIIDNPQNYALKFDVYNASDRLENFGVEYEGFNTYSTIVIETGQWAEYSYNIKALDDLSVSWGRDEKVSESGTFVDLRWNTQEEIYTTELFLDNVRIEKIA